MAEQQDAAALAIEQVLVGGNLAALTPTQRLRYYKLLCEALGLNYLTRPFEYITVQGKMILYAKRDATDQLRKIHGIAITIVGRERYEDAYVVTARASMPNGRTDEAVGAVSLQGLKGTDFANALMKAETKAKRRVTLSIAGLGWSDETEVEDIASALMQGKQVKAIAPARKFSELTDQEKREALNRGWGQRAHTIQERLIVGEVIPSPDFAVEDLEKLIQAAKLLGEMEKEEESERLSELLRDLNDLLTTEPTDQTGESTTNGTH